MRPGGRLLIARTPRRGPSGRLNVLTSQVRFSALEIVAMSSRSTVASMSKPCAVTMEESPIAELAGELAVEGDVLRLAWSHQGVGPAWSRPWRRNVVATNAVT